MANELIERSKKLIEQNKELKKPKKVICEICGNVMEV